MAFTPQEIIDVNRAWSSLLSLVGIRKTPETLSEYIIAGGGAGSLTTYAGSKSWNPGTLNIGATLNSGDITVTGAVLGDYVIASAPYSLRGILVNAYVTASNKVQIDIYNAGGGPVTLANGTWKVLVIQS
jgi:hypothetical protein